MFLELSLFLYYYSLLNQWHPYFYLDMREYTLDVTGMDCQSCEQTLQNELIRIPGITNAEPNVDSNEVRICDELSPKFHGGRQAIIEARARKAILDAGYRLSK